MGTLPQDDNNKVVQLTPAKTAIDRDVLSSLSSSTTLALESTTKVLRLYATGQDVYFKWGSTAVTASNFDEVVPAEQVIDLFVPDDSTGALYTTCRVIERNASAALVAIQK